MLKKLFIITLTMLLQIFTFGQKQRTIIHKPTQPIEVRPVQPGQLPGGQFGKFFYIATTEVRLSGERDVVPITNKDIFRAIKFNVTRNALEVYDLTVVFDNGQKQSFPVRKIYQSGTESGVLNFKGIYRRLKSIVFTYRTRGYLYSKKARVMIYGVK